MEDRTGFERVSVTLKTAETLPAAAKAMARAPELAIVPPPVAAAEAPPARRRRPLVITIGKALRGVFDRAIERSSRIPNDPVLDVRLFPWTELLRAEWQAIRDEAIAVALRGHAAPSLAAISPDHRAIAQIGKWRSFFLWGYGYRIDANADRCPRTSALVERIPGLTSAFFSILAPGTHIPDHRGVSKGLVTCHLGLIVPRDGDVRMRVGDRVVRWAEGETLVFDDTYRHEVWNEAGGTRVVLLLQFERPLRQPGRWIAETFMGFVRRSPFVQDARRNIDRWNAAVNRFDR